MSDGARAAATLDAFCARPPDAAAAKFDGRDFRGEVLRAVAEARDLLPAWWDAERACVSLPAADFRGRSLRSVNLAGALLERADFAELERHDAELRAIPQRFVSGIKLVFQSAFDRAVSFGDFSADNAGFRVHAELEDMRDGQDAEFRAAMLVEHENRRRRQRVEEIKRRASLKAIRAME